MTREIIAEILKEWLPSTVDVLDLYNAADAVEDYVLDTYGPPF